MSCWKLWIWYRECSLVIENSEFNDNRSDGKAFGISSNAFVLGPSPGTDNIRITNTIVSGTTSTVNNAYGIMLDGTLFQPNTASTENVVIKCCQVFKYHKFFRGWNSWSSWYLCS